MPKKSNTSKALKKRKSSKTPNLCRAKGVNLSTIDTITKQTSGETVIASIRNEICSTSFSDISNTEEFNSSFSVVNKSPIESFHPVSPNSFISEEDLSCSKSLIGSESDYFPGAPPVTPDISPSILNLSESNMRSKSVEPHETSILVEPPLRKICSQPNLKSDITDEELQSLFQEFTGKRREYFVCLFETAKSIVEFMAYLATIRKSNREKTYFENTRWKENDASDYFYFLNMWDLVQENLKLFLNILRYAYSDFKEEMTIALSVEEFFAFVCDLEDFFTTTDEFLQIYKNCYYKFKRFCTSNSEILFLKEVAEYRPQLTNFHKKLKIELDNFTFFRHFLTDA